MDTRPLNEGLQTLAALSPYVRCVHTPLTGAAATMREATRVILGTPVTVSSISATDFVFIHLQYLVVMKDLTRFPLPNTTSGASALLSNGSMLAPAGTAMVAAVASVLLHFCAIYKHVIITYHM